MYDVSLFAIIVKKRQILFDVIRGRNTDVFDKHYVIFNGSINTKEANELEISGTY